MTAPLRTTIESDRQRYVDEPVHVEISKARPLALAVNYAVRTLSPKTPAPPIFPLIYDISHYERSQIRWMRPDGRGGFQQRKQR